mgnify:CR=1 FL=1
MRRRVLRLLQRLGLIGPAFRAYERAVALRPQRVTPTEDLPLPPRRLMVRVAGTADADWAKALPARVRPAATNKACIDRDIIISM